MTDTDPILAETTRRLVEGFDPLRIILFGSRARGTADDRSDYDLMIICEISGGADRMDLSLKMTQSLRGLMIGTDILILTPEEYELSSTIPGDAAYYARDEGRVLYERAA